MSGTVSTGAVQTVGPVVFDYTWWSVRYPDLATWTSPAMGQNYFDLATLYLDNTDGGTPNFIEGYGYVGQGWCGSPVRDVRQRQMLLGLLTAHIAQLNAPLGGEPASTLVGRISNASEGSVSVAAEYPAIVGAEFFLQTRYGAMFWDATKRYRMAKYYPGPQPFAQISAPFGYGRGRVF